MEFRERTDVTFQKSTGSRFTNDRRAFKRFFSLQLETFERFGEPRLVDISRRRFQPPG